MTISSREATIPDAPTGPFSARLRESTREDHERAERSPFVTAYLAGRLPRDAFTALQGQLWFIYRALETAAQELRDHPIVGMFLDPRLDRVTALEADLCCLVGADWRDHVRAGHATRAHAERISRLARTWPAGYLAHHYIRYLGDLSGGRALGHQARVTYQLTDDGVRFYRFDDISSPREFKDGYRRLLDQAPWSESERMSIVDEARHGFRLSGAMFAELERMFPDVPPA